MGVVKTLWFVLFVGTTTIFQFVRIHLWALWYWLKGVPFPSAFAHSCGIAWGRLIMRLTPGWSVSVDGHEFLPPAGEAAILVANHESATDIFGIYLLGVQFKWLAKFELFKLPLLGPCMRRAGYVPIKRGDSKSHELALNDLEKWLAKKVPVLFFPEGTRSKTGRPKAFKRGAFRMSKKTSIPVVPIVLSGAGKLLAKGSICPSPATMKIKVLPAMQAKPEESVQDFTLRVQDLVTTEHAKLRGEGYEKLGNRDPTST